MYVVERQSAEGLFFHRSCFRCTVCKCRLLLGNYAYYCEDENGEECEGKFYCKVHYNGIIYKGSSGTNKKEERNLKPSGLKDSGMSLTMSFRLHLFSTCFRDIFFSLDF